MSDTFAPIAGLFGGSIMGIACAILLVGNGDILGCSGVSGRFLLNPMSAFDGRRWEIIFLVSFVITSNLYNTWIVTPGQSEVLSETIPYVSNLGYIFGGLFVGLGTRLGSGCTSGHGLCGLARVSKRAFVAVITFMGSGMLTATCITLYVDFLRCSPQDSLFSKPLAHILGLIILVSTIIGGGMSLAYAGKDSKIPDAEDLVNEESALAIIGTDEIIDDTAIARSNETKKYLYASIAAALFAIGLAVSGMIYQNKIIDFLDLTRFANFSWDGTLAMVMGGGLLFSAYGYHWVKGIGITEHQNAISLPLKSDHFNIPCETKIVDTQLIVGNILFGCGWAIAGFCPGPALYQFATGNPKVVFIWMPANIIGMFIAEAVMPFFA